MKKVLLIVSCIIISVSSFSQITGENIDELIKTLKSSGKSEETIKDIMNGVIVDPGLYNKLWKELIDKANKQDSLKWNFLRNLNILFKTFQTADSANMSLGFSYDFRFNYVNFKEK